jgi:hypothetical protein
MIDPKLKIIGDFMEMYHEAKTDKQKELIVKMVHEFLGGMENE